MRSTALHLSLLIVIILSSLSLNAQQISSTDVKKIKKSEQMLILGGTSKLFYTAAGSGLQSLHSDDATFSVFNRNLDQNYIGKIKPLESKHTILYVFSAWDALYWLEASDKPDNNGRYKTELVMKEGDQDPVVQASVATSFATASFQMDWSLAFTSFFTNAALLWKKNFGFSHTLSPDGNSVVILFNNNFSPSGNRMVNAWVYNQKDNSLSAQQINFKTEHNYMLLQDVFLANDGTDYLLAGSYTDKDMNRQKGEFSYTLVRHMMEGKTSTIKLSASDHFINSLGIYDGKGNFPILAGLSTQDNGDVAGAFIGSASAENELKLNYYPLDNFSVSAEEQDKDSKYTSTYLIHKMAPLKDGTLILLAEQYHRRPTVQAKFSLSGISPEAVMADYFENIVAIGFDASQKLSFSKVIEKKQKATDDEWQFASFLTFEREDGVDIIFNEDMKSMTDVKDVHLSENGKITDGMLFTKKEDRFRIAPSSSVQDGNTLIFPVVKFSKYKIYKLSY